MSNNWFQFKSFLVRQDNCAMKVSTDACIQGAWTPIAGNIQRVLDIGTGTGLLSLMLAQRTDNTYIDAIEIDKAAAQQATGNMQQSPWQERLSVINGDIAHWQPAYRYDLIICNPPFFNNSLLGDDKSRNQARHTLSLTHDALFANIDRLLSENGCASVLLPATEHIHWEKLVAGFGWYVTHRLFIIPRLGGKANRVVSLIKKGTYVTSSTDEHVCIRTENNEYTEAFKALLQPFYLHL